jgi:putative pyrroloquinoline-quinone binding quinoprotein
LGRGVVAVAALVLVASAAGSSGSSPITGWTTFGNGLGRSSLASSAVSGARNAWAVKLPGTITSQPIVVRGAPGTHRATVYFATSVGVVAAFSDTGRQLWRVKVGKLAHVCKQLPGYGVTGTPVADPVTGALYLADGVGRLHALDLQTGKERAGWPVRLYTDFRQELVWGALTAIHGSIYLGTGSYCDAPMVGKVIRVNARTRAVSRWDVVPEERGGGGGVWGWGGLAYSSARQSLLAVTGNAFRGGSNDGDAFREWEPYGEHLVELSLSLKVRSASHPAGLVAADDLDFVGSPVIVTRPACPEQVVALNKNGRLYAWRTKSIKAGPAWTLQLAPSNPASPLVTQAAYSAPLRALFVDTPKGLVKIAIGSRCTGTIAWKRKQGVIQSTPTVAGSIVWQVGWHSGAALIGIDGRTGRVRERHALGKDLYYVGPAVLDGRMYLGSFGGLVRALE